MASLSIVHLPLFPGLCVTEDEINNDKCLHCALDKNTYPMLQDKKIKSSAKLQ